MKLGDHVQPKPEWVGAPWNTPTGKIVGFGMAGQAVYLEGVRCAWATYVFDVVEPPEAESKQIEMFKPELSSSQGGE